MSGRILSSYMKSFIKLALKDGNSACLPPFFSFARKETGLLSAVSSVVVEMRIQISLIMMECRHCIRVFKILFSQQVFKITQYYVSVNKSTVPFDFQHSLCGFLAFLLVFCKTIVDSRMNTWHKEFLFDQLAYTSVQTKLKNRSWQKGK